MHKDFYASGFIYHLKTQQILLHQPKNTTTGPNSWTMFGGSGNKKEDPKVAFQRIVNKLLKIKLDLKKIHPVYDYFDNAQNTNRYVFYAEIGRPQKFISNKGIFSWFTFKQTLGLTFTDETKQDIIVSDRVIKANARDKEAKLSPTSANLSI